MFKVHVKGRLSSPILSSLAKDMVLRNGYAAIDESDSEMDNFKARFAFFRTAALQNFTITLEFHDAVVVETKSQFSRSDIWVGMNGNFESEILVEIDNGQQSIHYNIMGVPEVETYLILTEDEGFAIVSDVDDTIKETGTEAFSYRCNVDPNNH
jgi:phosphatidate phosphatase APP1